MRHFTEKSLVSLSFLSALTVLTGVSPSQAANVTRNFTANVLEGPFAGQVATGNFTYDDTLLITGNEVIRAADGLRLNLTFLGQTYTEANDLDYINTPQLDFVGGVPTFLDYFVFDGFSQTNIVNPNVESLSILAELTPAAGGGFTTTLDVGIVPEHTSIISLLVLGSLGVGCSFLKKAKKN